MEAFRTGWDAARRGSECETANPIPPSRIFLAIYKATKAGEVGTARPSGMQARSWRRSDSDTRDGDRDGDRDRGDDGDGEGRREGVGYISKERAEPRLGERKLHERRREAEADTVVFAATPCGCTK